MYVASCVVTYPSGRTVVTHLTIDPRNPVFTPFDTDTKLFRTAHEARAYLHKTGFPPTGERPFKLYKGARVVYMHTEVPDTHVQWPIGIVSTPEDEPGTRKTPHVSPHRVASIKLARERRLATIKED